MPAMLELTGLTKAYGRVLAVRDLDLELEGGQVVGFLGPNGAGKTTVLRVLTGGLRATAGSASVLGRDPWRQAASLHEDVGYLPGDLRLPSNLTGREVLDLCGRLRARGTSRRSEVVERLRVDLDTPLQALSKGNRQKVGLVQAFMGDPAVLLLDEPTSGLDPMAQEQVDQLMTEAAARGTLVLLSSHVLSEVDRVADQVAMLRRGRLLGVERLADLRSAAPHVVHVRSDRPWVPPEGVRDVTVAGDTTRFTTTTTLLPQLVAALVDVPLIDLTIESADLEELFLSRYEEVDDAA